MASKLSSEEEKEHEAFKNRLVHDVLGREDNDKVPMEKVVMLIWMFREEAEVVTFMSRFVAKYAGNRDVFDGVEFYLPQLAHMIIHLEADWDDEILERFALVIAQQSLHFALQLNWILQGALDDYQPEMKETGDANPNYNPVYYLRCLKLIKNVERCVVYGKPRAQELQRLYEKGKITKEEMKILERADRRFNAQQIMTSDDDHERLYERLDGWLYVQPPYKPNEKESSSLDYRFCVLERNIFNVYKTKGTCNSDLVIDRAMQLEGAVFAEAPRHGVEITTQHYTFKILCGTAEERNLWMRRLTEEAQSSNLFATSSKTVTSSMKQDLTPQQRNRYEFFQDERAFIERLVGIAEDLRFEERSERKKLAPGKMAQLEIPHRVYLPLCNSSNIWRRVSDKLAKHTRVFNTKERCPTVMHFVCRRGELSERGGQHRIDPTVDVAEYMHQYFNIVQEMEKVDEAAEEEEEEEQQEAPTTTTTPQKTNLASSSRVWDEEDEKDDDDEKKEKSKPSPTRGGSSSRNLPPRGNLRVQKLMGESVMAMPSVLQKRMTLGKKRGASVMSVLDRQTEMPNTVPILQGATTKQLSMKLVVPGSGESASAGATTGAGDDDEKSVVSVEQSSMLIKNEIVQGDMDEGEIDVESIERATQIISGGTSWAKKSAELLNEYIASQPPMDDQEQQLEIQSCLAKSNDDLRQEVFVMQMIHYYKSVFAQAQLPLWLKTYRILSTDASTGLLELLTDATSIDALKKSDGFPGSLRLYFEQVYGGKDSKAFKAAQANFTNSLAAYAIVSYLLGLKDRHNGNIMIDTRGHLIFIDFGFAFGMKPGHEFSFEQAPFKLTKEYVEVMDGVGSECYKEFERLFVAGFSEARKNSQIALGLVEIMMFQSNYPCFSGWRYGNGKALVGFEKRLMLRVPDKAVKNKALALIRKSKQNFGTYLYDAFQKATNGYAI